MSHLCSPPHQKQLCSPTAHSWEPHKDRALSSSSFPACSGPTRSCWGMTQQMWPQLASSFHTTPGCEEHGENDLNVPVLPVEWGWPGFVPQAERSLSMHEGRCHGKGGHSHRAILHPRRKCCSEGSVGWEGGVPAPPSWLCHMLVTPSGAQRNLARLSCMCGLQRTATNCANHHL